MRLSIKPPITFTDVAELSVPGQADKARLLITWRHLDRRTLRAWIDQANAPTDDPVQRDVEWLDQVIHSWPEGPCDEKGQPVPYGRDALRDLLVAYPGSGGELYQAYMRALHQGREKNSAGRPV